MQNSQYVRAEQMVHAIQGVLGLHPISRAFAISVMKRTPQSHRRRTPARGRPAQAVAHGVRDFLDHRVLIMASQNEPPLLLEFNNLADDRLNGEHRKKSSNIHKRSAFKQKARGSGYVAWQSREPNPRSTCVAASETGHRAAAVKHPLGVTQPGLRAAC
jgi:hypothetical protein